MCYVTYSIYVYVGDFDNLYLYIDFRSCNMFTYCSLYNVFAYLKSHTSGFDNLCLLVFVY